MKTRHIHNARGSVLIVCLIFSAIIAISIASFLSLATNATRISYRTFNLGVAMNVAETGLERTVWAINAAKDGNSAAWDGWTKDSAGSDYYKRSFDLGAFDGGATAVVKIYAKDTSTTPVVFARSIITPPDGPTIEKWIQVKLARRSSTAGGVGGLGKQGITANGANVEFASWNSDPDKNDATPYIPFSESVKNDNTKLATLKIEADLDSGNAKVNGSAAVGSKSLEDIKVGSQGYIGPFGTPVGTKDPDSVSTDFSADLDIIPAPTTTKNSSGTTVNITYTGLGPINTTTTLPRTGDTPNADGVYYYTAGSISLNNEILEIKDGYDVVITISNALDDISVGGGSGGININGTKDTTTGTITTGSLKIYTAGDVDIGGQGVANQVSWTETTTTTQTVSSRVRAADGRGWTTVYSTVEVAASETVTQSGQPKDFQIYGTRTDEQVAASGDKFQSFKIHGNGNLSAVVYAPNADIEAKGGGTDGFIYGSLVGNTLTFTGNDAFYYDESLADLNALSYSRFGIDSWIEYITAEKRATLASLMDF